MAHEHTQRVLLLGDLPLEVRDRDRRVVDLGLELPNVELGDQPLLKAPQRELQRLLTRRERPLRDREIQIELAEL
jgi:hypothetical protein